MIDAAYLHSYPNCYFIGPFAKRVSFASQQYRAIDLIAALKRKNKLTQNMSIAVVGAGLAGLMATAALCGIKCKKVHLYETVSPLHRQKDAFHRVVHPTISRWPMEELKHTTEFPFLDWFAGPSNRIIEHLVAQWKQILAAKEGMDGFEFKDNTIVEKFSFTQGSYRQVRLTTARRTGDGELVAGASNEFYDLVFVTVGFGDENTIGDFNATSYWTPDELALKSPEELAKWRTGRQQILISGCGDGGLIDCLRHIHGYFRHGWLPIEVAEMLADFEEGKIDIQNAEHDALIAARSIACMPPAAVQGRGRDKLLEAARFEVARSDDYVNALADVYLAVVDKLPKDVRKFLDDSIAASGMQPGKVTLVSKEVQPFVPYSAPIHKLMIAHALQTAHVTYVSGQVVDYKKRTAHVARRTGERDKFKEPSLAVRHGAPANMVGGIHHDERASLRIRQLLMADYIDRKTKRILEPPPGYPIRAVSEQGFYASRYAMAKALVGQIDPAMRVSATKDGFEYVKAGEPPSEAAKPLQLALPRKLFDINAISGELVDETLL